MRIAITGSSGQTPQLTLLPVTRSDADFNDPAAVSAFFSDLEVDAVINAAAYTAVDQAESEPERADIINHHSVAALGRILAARQIPLIHLSTDYVFSGHGHRPWQPEDPTKPINQYGASKLKGERALRDCGVTGLIVRVSWLFSPFRKNFVTTIASLAQERSCLEVVADQIGSPTSALDAARFLLSLFTHNDPRLTQPVSVTHFANSGVASWYDLACAITTELAPHCTVRAIDSKEWPTAARRPSFSVLAVPESPRSRWWQEGLQEALILMNSPHSPENPSITH